MTDFLKILLSLSLSGTLLILGIFLLKPLWKDKLSKQWQYYIWLIVVARLLIPFAPETNLSGVIFQQLETAYDLDIPDLQNNTGQAPITGSNKSIYQEKPPEAANPLPIVQNTPPLSTYIFLAWFVVALILFIRKITIYQSFVQYVKAGRIPVDEVSVLNRFGGLLSDAGIKKNIDLAANPLISSPLFMGFFRPCIVLPDVALAETDFYYTIRHELTHYKRRDMFYKWIVQLVICIHWFNPFVYMMSREIIHACELSCDEAVIRHMTGEEKAAYGDTLLNAMEAGGNYKASLASVTLNESKALLKERLDAIMSFQKTTPLTAAVSIALAFSLCFGATAAGAYTGLPPSSRKGRTVIQPDQPLSSPANDGSLALVEKEYRLADLSSLDISGIVVETSSDNVTITRGGNNLKFEYYTRDENEYTLQREADSGGTRWDLCFVQVSSPHNAGRSIRITIPYDVNLETLKVVTSSGNIQLDECTASTFMAVETQSGYALISGGSSKGFFSIKTGSGTALISGTVLPVRGVQESSANFYTDNGTILFQPSGSVWDYRYRLDTGEKAQIYVNGKQYQGGGGNINHFSHSQIDVEIATGSLIVQDLNMGKLSLDFPAAQPNQTSSADPSYWTEDEFVIFMQEQEQKYKALLASGDITQDEFNIYMTEDKETLREIRNGAKIAKTATGSIEKGIGTESSSDIGSIEIKIDHLNQSEQVVYGPYQLKSGSKWGVDISWDGNGMISVSCQRSKEYSGEQLVQQVSPPIDYNFIVPEDGEYIFVIKNQYAVSEKYQLDPSVLNVKGVIYVEEKYPTPAPESNDNKIGSEKKGHSVIIYDENTGKTTYYD